MICYLKLLVIFYLWIHVIRTAPVNQSTFSFDDIYGGQFYPKSFHMEWIKNTESFFYTNTTNDIVLYNATDDTTSLYLQSSLFMELRASKHFACSDKKFVLFAYHVRPVWRHSFTAKYLIYNLETKKKYYFPNGPLQNETLAFAGWSPVGYSLLFVCKNNIYVQNGIDEIPQQITFDGDQGISNGVPDWLYEEEILEDGIANSWSPSGRFIFHAKFDVTYIPKHYWLYYGRNDNVYGRLKGVHYPKAGHAYGTEMPGPTTFVDLFITDIKGENITTVQLKAPIHLRKTDHYYLNAAWRDDQHILVVWSNRVQNVSTTILYDVQNPSEMTEVLTTSESNGWIEVPHPNPWFLQNGEQYLTILPHKVLPKPSRQIAIVTCKRGVKDKVTFLTQGEQVESIVGMNKKTGFVYYITWYHVKGRQLWRIKIPFLFPPTGTYPLAECMYCNEVHDYIGASFSTSSDNYILQVLGPDLPKFYLRSNVAGKEYKSIAMEENYNLKESLKKKQWPTKDYFQYNIGDGSVGYGQMLIPPNPGKDEIFPLLVFTYAGPGTQAVSTKFIIQKPWDIWLLHMATEYRTVVVWTDGRGSSSEGDDLKFAIYKKMATVEVEDQMLGVEYVKKNGGLKISNNSAIFGWSYGGFVAAHALANENDTFTCAVSVAPPTNKGIYDTAYTERYLGLITEDGGSEIYSRTNLVHKAKFFKKKKFFIAQGIADDNVHYTHFAHLVRELQKHQVMFRQNSYPDENHAITTIEVNKHLFRSIIDFLINDCWPGRFKEDLWSFEGVFHTLKDFVTGFF